MSKLARNLLLICLAVMLSSSPLLANAMPVVPAQADNMVMMDDMGMGNCHHQQADKKCSHCNDMHQCNATHSHCFSSAAIPSQSFQFTVTLNQFASPIAVAGKHSYQLITLLLRPPISA